MLLVLHYLLFLVKSAFLICYGFTFVSRIFKSVLVGKGSGSCHWKTTLITPSSLPFKSHCLSVSASGELVCVGGKDGSAAIHSDSTCKVCFYLYSNNFGKIWKAHKGQIATVELMQFDGISYVVTCKWNSRVKVWHIHTQEDHVFANYCFFLKKVDNYITCRS